jgi:hypothetical protein
LETKDDLFRNLIEEIKSIDINEDEEVDLAAAVGEIVKDTSHPSTPQKANSTPPTPQKANTTPPTPQKVESPEISKTPAPKSPVVSKLEEPEEPEDLDDEIEKALAEELDN